MSIKAVSVQLASMEVYLLQYVPVIALAYCIYKLVESVLIKFITATSDHRSSSFLHSSLPDERSNGIIQLFTFRVYNGLAWHCWGLHRFVGAA